ncbi:MAG: TolC family protein [Bryobacteraceae bacterium]|jgi:outer membrane protein TolC
MTIVSAQESSIVPQRPNANIVIRPYLPTTVPPSRLQNSARVRDLVRAGVLYLTVQDAIALALENNIDIEVARYNPIIAQWNLERFKAGGALPGVPSGASQVGQVASGQGVAGSQAAAGISTTGSAGVGNNTTNATVSQIGPQTQTYDPIIQESSVFSHTTAPQPNITQSLTPFLVDDTRAQNFSYQQGFVTGGSASVSFTDNYLKENAPTDILNPSSAPTFSISFQHNLLRGFGIAVGYRNIAVAKLNLRTSDLVFKSQVISVVANVLNLYYGLVADYDDVSSKKTALEAAQKLYSDNKEQVRIGSLAQLDLTTAEASVASAEQDLVVSQTTLFQQEIQLKSVLSRTGGTDPVLVTARIVPLDRIEIPDRDEFPPVGDLVKQALAKRSDLATEKFNFQSSQISALGTRNGLLPNLIGFAGDTQKGLSGVGHTIVTPEGTELPDPYFVGNIGTALGQIVRNDFPAYHGGIFYQAPILNEQAQADYAVDQLTLRQTELQNQKDANQVQVDVMNSVVAIRQARARYQAAVHNRILDQQLLDAEQRKYSLGASIPYNVIVQQRELDLAKTTELSALVSYSNARVTLEQTLGTILDTYHVSIGEAVSGKVARPSVLPANLPAPPEIH